ncbi:MAG: PilZ domain-containing protein [Deltaproteobacteria bacterium]|nr:PilZ domain-containing protein [Deltaproteobacteria bacterium]
MTVTLPTAQVAAELLGLEQSYQSGGLDRAQDKRWGHLVNALIRNLCANERNRKNLRIPTRGDAVLHRARSHFRCVVDDLSHFGIGISGTLGRLSVGDKVCVSQLNVGGEQLDLSIDCRVAWIEQVAPRKRRAGLQLTNIDPVARTDYFRALYYPAYLNYLRSLC